MARYSSLFRASPLLFSVRSLSTIISRTTTATAAAFVTKGLFHRRTIHKQKSGNNMWDDRYGSTEDYVYGTIPNGFLLETISSRTLDLPETAKCLMLAEGEGRNAVYMAQQPSSSSSYQVVAVDSSSVGLEKAQRLAESQSVTIETIVADLGNYSLGEAEWDCIVGIYCHFPPSIRDKVLSAIPTALKPGGYVVMECYTPKQLEYKTGGPPNAEFMYTKELLQDTVGSQLEIIRNEELVRSVVEGTFHNGDGAVVQFIARKPPAA